MAKRLKYPDGPIRFDHCPGCGYYWLTHDRQHREDCTLDGERSKIWHADLARHLG